MTEEVAEHIAESRGVKSAPAKIRTISAGAGVIIRRAVRRTIRPRLAAVSAEAGEMMEPAERPLAKAFRSRGIRERIAVRIAIGIVILPLCAVTQHLVCLVDFLELLLRDIAVLIHVRVIFFCQLAERRLDLRVRRIPAHAQNLIIVLSLRHGQSPPSAAFLFSLSKYFDVLSITTPRAALLPFE